MRAYMIAICALLLALIWGFDATAGGRDAGLAASVSHADGPSIGVTQPTSADDDCEARQDIIYNGADDSTMTVYYSHAGGYGSVSLTAGNYLFFAYAGSEAGDECVLDPELDSVCVEAKPDYVFICRDDGHCYTLFDCRGGNVIALPHGARLVTDVFSDLFLVDLADGTRAPGFTITEAAMIELEAWAVENGIDQTGTDPLHLPDPIYAYRVVELNADGDLVAGVRFSREPAVQILTEDGALLIWPHWPRARTNWISAAADG